MLVLVMAIGCAAYHVHTPEADLAVSATPYGSRQMVDAETGHDAVAKASRDVPVTYVTTTRTPFGETSTVVTLGGHVATAPRSGNDPRPDASADYRARYTTAPRTVYVQAPGAKDVASVRATGSVPAEVNMSAACPTDRDPATQAERDACQEQDISRILDDVGTVKGGGK